MLARGPRLLSKLMQPGRKDQRQREAVVVRQVPRQCEGLTAPVETLLRMTEMPQCQRGIGQANHCRRMRALLLGLIEPGASLQILQRRGHVPQPERRNAERSVGFDEQTRILDVHRQLEKLLAGRAGGVQLAPNVVESIQPMKRGEELRRCLA